MKIIRPEDLHDDDFLIERNKVRVKKELKKYNLTYENAARFADNIGNTNDATNRLYLQVLDGMGKIHIDGKLRTTVSNGVIARLPKDAPVPLSLIEAGVYVGETFGSIWVNGNTREVYTNGLPVGKRIVVDLVGFFV
jgi:hypothetical protein